MSKPSLQGVRVVDLSRFIAGPYCGMLLGDLGADVIKVERSGIGEDSRHMPPSLGGETLYTLVYNRNKRGMTLNFRHPRGQTLLRDLAARADVLIENFRPGTLEQMGCDWSRLHALNPRLIVARISGFGQDGPYAQRPGFDGIGQAMSGLMSLTGQPDGPPTLCGTYLVDYSTALYTTIAVLAALHARQHSGQGQLIDMALLDSATSLLMTAIPQQANLGVTLSRNGNRDRFAAPVSAFPTADGGWVLLAAGIDAHFQRAVAATGLKHLLDDPRFQTIAARVEHAAEVESALAEWTRRHTAEEIVARMSEFEVPCAKVATLDEVVANPQLRHRGQIVEVDHPTAGRVTMAGPTMHLSESPVEIRRPPPTLGQHTREVLAEWLGLGAAELDTLARDGAI